MRAGGGFWMVLHTEQRQRFVPQAFKRLVVQIHMRQFHLAQIDRIGIDGEVMIVRGNFHLASEIVSDRMIAAVMAELELVGPPAQR